MEINIARSQSYCSPIQAIVRVQLLSEVTHSSNRIYVHGLSESFLFKQFTMTWDWASSRQASKYFDNQAASDCDKYGTGIDADCAVELVMERQQQMGICTGAQQNTILAIGSTTLLQ
ncbi:hypothetical protein B0H11DRAFT_1928291 [Mycena galericulata]|nr:hypothetical protein B0H11DRAFT_1928291 [Mycena galericulata]